MELPLDRCWTAFGRLVAILAGALVVLLGLLADVPVDAACLRAFVAFLAIRALTRVGAAAIAWTSTRTVPRAAAQPAGEEVIGG